MQPLKVGISTIPSILTFKKKHNIFTIGGGYGTWLEKVCQSFICEYIISQKSGTSQLLPNGTWTEEFELVQRGMIHYTNAYEPTAENYQLVSPVVFSFSESYGILASKRVGVHSAFVFSPLVVSLLVISLLCTCLAITVFERRPAKDCFKELLYLFNTLSYEGHPIPPRSKKSRFILMLWYFTMVIVLVNVLVGYLTSTFSVSSTKPAFISLLDLPKYPDVEIMTLNDGYRGLQDALPRKIFQKLKKRILIISSKEMVKTKIIKKLKDENVVFILGFHAMKGFLSLYIKRFGTCEHYRFPIDGIGTYTLAFGLSHQMPDQGKRVKRKLMSYMENGISVHIFRNLLGINMEKCLEVHVNEVEQLTLQKLMPYFKMYIYGMTAACISAIFEIFAVRFQNYV